MNKNRRSSGDGIVYSTQDGKMCPGCGQPVAGCRCRQVRSPDWGDKVIRVGRETQGRKGKGVTTITGIPLAAAELKALATELKRMVGSGGTVKDGVIEIQGDHRDRIVSALQGRGWTVKRSGG